MTFAISMFNDHYFVDVTDLFDPNKFVWSFLGVSQWSQSSTNWQDRKGLKSTISDLTLTKCDYLNHELRIDEYSQLLHHYSFENYFRCVKIFEVLQLSHHTIDCIYRSYKRYHYRTKIELQFICYNCIPNSVHTTFPDKLYN